VQTSAEKIRSIIKVNLIEDFKTLQCRFCALSMGMAFFLFTKCSNVRKYIYQMLIGLLLANLV